jgi:arylsulfatase A-like enzyme
VAKDGGVANGSAVKALAAFLAVGAGFLAASLPRHRPRALSVHRRLVEQRPGAAGGVVARSGAAPRVTEVERAGDRRPTLALDAPGTWAFTVRVPPRGSFRFALDVQPEKAPVTLRLQRRHAQGLETLHERRWEGKGGWWGDRKVDLDRFAGQELDLEISLEGPAATVHLADPLILGEPEAGDPPNILIYLVDCLRADHVGAYGYPRPTTPEIDALARDGVVFENVYSCASWTKPSVGCLFTSLYPTSHGARTVDAVLDGHPATLAEVLGARGYATAAWVANPLVATSAFGLARGFDRVVQVGEGSPSMNLNRLNADAAQITRDVVSWLGHRSEWRFFAYIHSLDLHAEYRPRPPFDQVFVNPQATGAARDVDLYDNELAYNDRELGRVVQALKRLSLYDNTLIVVTADHGEEFGEHGTFRHGRSLYDSLLHVPLILKLPRSRQSGRRVGALASNVDIAPTLLDLAGLAPAPGFRGVSLRAALDDGRTALRQSVLAEQISPKEVLYAARDSRFKYVYQLIPEPRQMLFDLERDPAEQANLLPGIPDGARGLMSELFTFMQLAQEGYHLSLSDPDPAAWIHVEASTTAVFTDLQRYSMDLEESLTFSPDRHRVDYRLLAGSLPRHVVLRTSPAGAPVRFRLSSGTRLLGPAEVALGARGLPPAASPFETDPLVLSVSMAQATELLEARGARARLWYLPAPSRDRNPRIDAELEAKLRALGYVQ